MTDEPKPGVTRLREQAGAEGELLSSALGDRPRAALREAAMERVLAEHRARRGAKRVAAGIGAGVALALAAGVALVLRAPAPAPKLTAEAPSAPSTARPSPTKQAAPTPAADPLAPCTPAAVAAGTAPLIDDFEDGDARVLLSEKRAGNWITFNDGTGVQTPRPGTNFRADRIPGGRGASHFGLHNRGGKFTSWGAAVAAELNPRRCYDASAYGGVEFWARGRGHLRIAAKMTQIVTEEFGGSCVQRCFDAHLTQRSLSDDWKLYRVRWDELRQSGEGQAVPFDPRSLYSIEFSVLPDQTPFDFWLDDPAFLVADGAPASAPP